MKMWVVMLAVFTATVQAYRDRLSDSGGPNSEYASTRWRNQNDNSHFLQSLRHQFPDHPHLHPSSLSEQNPYNVQRQLHELGAGHLAYDIPVLKHHTGSSNERSDGHPSLSVYSKSSGTPRGQSDHDSVFGEQSYGTSSYSDQSYGSRSSDGDHSEHIDRSHRDTMAEGSGASKLNKLSSQPGSGSATKRGPWGPVHTLPDSSSRLRSLYRLLDNLRHGSTEQGTKGSSSLQQGGAENFKHQVSKKYHGQFLHNPVEPDLGKALSGGRLQKDGNGMKQDMSGEIETERRLKVDQPIYLMKEDGLYDLLGNDLSQNFQGRGRGPTDTNQSGKVLQRSHSGQEHSNSNVGRGGQNDNHFRNEEESHTSKTHPESDTEILGGKNQDKLGEDVGKKRAAEVTENRGKRNHSGDKDNVEGETLTQSESELENMDRNYPQYRNPTAEMINLKDRFAWPDSENNSSDDMISEQNNLRKRDSDTPDAAEDEDSSESSPDFPRDMTVFLLRFSEWLDDMEHEGSAGGNSSDNETVSRVDRDYREEDGKIGLNDTVDNVGSQNKSDTRDGRPRAQDGTVGNETRGRNDTAVNSEGKVSDQIANGTSVELDDAASDLDDKTSDQLDVKATDQLFPSQEAGSNKHSHSRVYPKASHEVQRKGINLDPLKPVDRKRGSVDTEAEGDTELFDRVISPTLASAAEPGDGHLMGRAAPPVPQISFPIPVSKYECPEGSFLSDIRSWMDVDMWVYTNLGVRNFLFSCRNLSSCMQVDHVNCSWAGERRGHQNTSFSCHGPSVISGWQMSTHPDPMETGYEMAFRCCPILSAPWKPPVKMSECVRISDVNVVWGDFNFTVPDGSVLYRVFTLEDAFRERIFSFEYCKPSL
ncbi:uncharacterized protein LOC143278110 [Babylonia areolata]|uniref:uncharacterized protein LOC143278110 n=1 Tax=Babylonia areolata TaxID=304850 RepID=UPI003FD1A82F